MADMTSRVDGLEARDAVDRADSSATPRWVTTTAIVVATILAIVSVMTTWVRTQALDTDQWVSASSDLLAEPVVQQALATYLTDELFAQADVTQELADALPDQLSGLAGPLTAALRPPATDAVEQLVGSPRFAQAWARANRVAHQTLVGVLRGDSTEVVSTSGGAITLDLGDALVAIGGDLGVSDSTLERIPPDAGQVVVFQSDQLASVQQTVRVLDALSWFLFVVVVGLYALAVVLARGRRRESLREVGVGLVVAGVTVILLRAIAIREGVDVLVTDAGNRELAGLVGKVGTELLQQMAVAGILYGVLFLVFAWMLGPHRWALRVRRGLARWSDSTAAIAAGAVVAFLVLVWLSPGGALDRWTTVLVLAGLAIGAVVMLRAQLGRDLLRPDQPFDDPAPAGD
ncbi:hypothetical protein [Salsipaludibacter albus]|uniref:hypothetical protein n=1 Tax=Salsipaludibacter albus TaxID=2849650 RepID=UPI001EE3FD44|nr:hypothetical protein [Salsipaludibacter albus]MBY5161318.1 hypothetical protein [Salsipaludibacter albus]